MKKKAQEVITLNRRICNIYLRRKVLDIIQIQITKTSGELVQFGRGISTVTFHFKR